MSDESQKAETVERSRCDHICLKDDQHVDRGEPHFYGYELPSPRALAAERDGLVTQLQEAEANLRAEREMADLIGRGSRANLERAEAAEQDAEIQRTAAYELGDRVAALTEALERGASEGRNLVPGAEDGEAAAIEAACRAVLGEQTP